MSYSARITVNVNRDIGKGRRAMGKGSRVTTYQNIFRTRREEMLQHARLLRATFRNSNARSRGEVSTQAKWFLLENAKATAANHAHFQFFSSILRERSISEAMLTEFIVYLLGNHEFTSVIGDDIVNTKKAPVVVKAEVVDDGEFGGWESNSFDMSGGGACPATINEAEWGCGGDAGSFSDEEDMM